MAFTPPERFNIAEHFLDRRVAEGGGEREALRLDGGSWSYREVQAAADRAGRALRRLGVRPGERVLIALPDGPLRALAEVVSVQTLWMLLVALLAGIVLAYTPFGQKVYATGGNIRAAAYAGINTNRVRFTALMLSALCATMAGIINVAYFRSFNPVAGQFRELDAIASVIIGGGSIFGGYGTVIGALAGAAVITLVRALLQLNVHGFSMPQHWVNAVIGFILISAVLIDIWLRESDLIARIREMFARRNLKTETADAKA